MPAKANSLRSSNVADDPAAAEAPTATLTAAPIDAPPSFLEKAEPNNNSEPIAHGERSNLQLYLQEIGKTALLTIDEEIQLAKRIRKGDKAARDHVWLKKDEWRSLIPEKANKGDSFEMPNSLLRRICRSHVEDPGRSARVLEVDAERGGASEPVGVQGIGERARRAHPLLLAGQARMGRRDRDQGTRRM